MIPLPPRKWSYLWSIAERSGSEGNEERRYPEGCSNGGSSGAEGCRTELVEYVAGKSGGASANHGVGRDDSVCRYNHNRREANTSQTLKQGRLCTRIKVSACGEANIDHNKDTSVRSAKAAILGNGERSRETSITHTDLNEDCEWGGAARKYLFI